MDTSTVRRNIGSLVEKFDTDKHYYLSKEYLEAQTREDFINPLFEALGWDISNKAGLPPFEREVLLEKGETTGRPDYNFRLGGTSKFFVEAKAPSESCHKKDHILKAKSYAWCSKEVEGVWFVVLTNFKELRLFDVSRRPDEKHSEAGLHLDLKYTEYPDKLGELLKLSKEAVSLGSLEKFLPKDAKAKSIPVDKEFLNDMSQWREELAKDIYKLNPNITVRTLSEVVQRLLDRIIFIRIAEDRKIIERNTLSDIVINWKDEGKRKAILDYLNALFSGINTDLNGDIFKPHACEEHKVGSDLLAKIIRDLYFPKSPYRFDVIGVELLGSIYERYLGNTIMVTPGGRVKVEEKPEVRKAGGVYYTPQYIVKYIVENTVGRLIEGKTPKQIEKIKILDPACGSGSFLLGAYQYLIDYHIKYYREHPKEAQTIQFEFYERARMENLSLPLSIKAGILKKNIFGVDIDPQAVEITMMSLYLKVLEGERRLLPKKQHLLPPLSGNIKCGNSLIGYDIFDQGQLFTDEEKERVNPFNWKSKKAGFGEIMERGGFDCVIGNPPYGYMIPLQEQEYFSMYYKYQDYQKDLYLLFLERYHYLLRNTGRLGVIVSNTWLQSLRLQKIRQYLTNNYRWLRVLHLPERVFSAVVDTHVLIFQKFSRGISDKDVVSVDIRRDEQIELLHNLQGKFIPHNGVPINIIASQKEQVLFRKIQSMSKQLGQLCDIYNGVKPFEKGKGVPPQTDKVLKEKPYVREGNAPDKTWSPLLRGELIRRYENLWNDDYWIMYGPWLAALRDPTIFKAPLKIMVRQTGDSIIASLIESGFIARNNLHIILPRDSHYQLQYLLGLMNSRLMDFAYTFTNPEKGEALAEIKKQHVEQLPIRTINFNDPKEKAMHDRLVSLVDHMLELNKKKHALPATSEREAVEREIAVTDEHIDDLVYELYRITEEERKIIEGAG